MRRFAKVVPAQTPLLESVQSTFPGPNPTDKTNVTQNWTGPVKALMSGELYEQKYRYVQTFTPRQVCY